MESSDEIEQMFCRRRAGLVIEKRLERFHRRLPECGEKPSEPVGPGRLGGQFALRRARRV
jgi:hypothetical protein